MNPPYHEESRHDVSPNSIKRTANTEKQGDLKLWIKAAASALKAGGVLTLIHRADRRDEILSLLAQDFGDLSVLCLLPKEGAEAKRILIRARKEDVSPRLSEKRIILHQAEGAYTNEIEGILRNANALIW